MDTFLENAQRIFDVAQADSSGQNSDFMLLVRADGSLHMVMEQTLNPESAAIAYGADTAYHVVRTGKRVTVSGRSGENRCQLTHGNSARTAPGRLLRDQPLYLLARQELAAPAEAAILCA